MSELEKVFNRRNLPFEVVDFKAVRVDLLGKWTTLEICRLGKLKWFYVDAVDADASQKREVEKMILEIK